MTKYEDYTVGWLCALPTEMAAAQGMLDERHGALPSRPQDNNNYAFGRVGDHNVVIACLPSGMTGTISAARVATRMLSTFKGLRFGLMVGIGGGVPSAEHDIRLGDVVVSKPTGAFGGVIQYDFGKTVQEGKVTRTGSLNKPPEVLLTALANLEAKHMMECPDVAKHLSEMTTKYPRMATQFTCPGKQYDTLYKSEYDHPGGYTTCSKCDHKELINRETRLSEDVAIHYGLIASGNQVMRHGGTRDRLGQEIDILCFEMEAAGLMDSFPCLVIRGICDYADSHKNDRWKSYAAGTAAAYAKELLSVIPREQVFGTQTAAEVITAAVVLSNSGTTNTESGNIIQGNNIGSANFYDSRSQGPKGEEAYACLTALFLTDPRDDRERLTHIKGSRVDGTCEWIKTNELYNSWLHSRSQLLWLSGGPGKGKTMLSIFVAEELERSASETQDVLFVQYFCDDKDEKRNTAVAILRGLIWQLLKQCPKLLFHILPSFKDRDKSQAITSFESLWRIFETMIRDPVLGTAYCVLDGLDECDEASLEMLLNKFKVLFSTRFDKSSACHLNLIAVSRDLPAFISDALSSFPRIRLDPDADREVNSDIDQFIKVKVSELSTSRNYPLPLQEHVRNVFRNSANGTFLWVGIVAKELREFAPAEVPDALKFFPPGLEGLYARMLLQINDRRRETAAKILRWVVMAVRPLTLSELSAAIETTVEPIVGFSCDEVIRDQVRFCGYLLTIKDNKVGLIHQSAKDYLLRQNPDPDHKLEFFRIEEEKANLEIARKSLDYLQNGALANGPVDMNDRRNTSHLNTFPLLSYAALHWPEHARSLASSEDIFNLSLPFYQNKSLVRRYWLETCWKGRGRYEALPNSFSLLHLASCFGIAPLVENLLFEKKGWMRLLKRVTFVDKRDEQGRTALHWAAISGHEIVVRLLLEAKADVNGTDEEGSTALHWAAISGHEIVVRLLLEVKADVNKTNKRGSTALHHTAWNGHEIILRLLLEAKADVNKMDKRGTTALHVAALRGYETVIRLLLEIKANVNRRDKSGSTALNIAALRGYETIVRLLSKAKTDVNTVDESK